MDKQMNKRTNKLSIEKILVGDTQPMGVNKVEVLGMTAGCITCWIVI